MVSITVMRVLIVLFDRVVSTYARRSESSVNEIDDWSDQ
jgi:hypothetical protein